MIPVGPELGGVLIGGREGPLKTEAGLRGARPKGTPGAREAGSTPTAPEPPEGTRPRRHPALRPPASALLFRAPVGGALRSGACGQLWVSGSDPWQRPEEGREGPRQEADKGSEARAIGPALGTGLGADLVMTRSRWEGTGGQDKVQVVTWEAGEPAGLPRGRRGGLRKGRASATHSDTWPCTLTRFVGTNPTRPEATCRPRNQGRPGTWTPRISRRSPLWKVTSSGPEPW